MTELLSLLLFMGSLILLNSRQPIFSKRPTFVGCVILLTVLVQIVPGLVLVTMFDWPMSFGVENLIDQDVKIFTFYYSLISLSFLNFFIYILTFFVDFNVDLNKFKLSDNEFNVLVIISLVIMSYKIISFDNVPLIMALSGNSLLAAEEKGRILTGNVGGGFFIGYLVTYFNFIVLAYGYIATKQRAVSTRKYILYIFIASIYSLLDLQKSGIVYLIFFLFSLRVVDIGLSFKTFVIFGILAALTLPVGFFLLHETSADQILDKVTSRLFIGQIEGSYMIYEALVPSFSRIYYGAPLKFIFDYPLIIDPAAEIVRIFFPTAGDEWVNSNTFVLAHAWSIFGFSAIIIAPVCIALNIAILILMRNLLIKYIGVFSNLIYITLLLGLKINNDFSLFLYPRSLVAFISLALCLWLIKILIQSRSAIRFMDL